MADLSRFTEYAKNFYLQRVMGYCLILLSSFFIIIPLGILQTKFDENCLLYSDVVYEYFNTSAGLHSVLFRIRFGPQSVCQYNLAVSALFSLIYSLAMIVGYIFMYLRDKSCKEIDLGQVWYLIHGLVEVAVVILMLVSACTITRGFTKLCGDITDTGLPAFQVHSCSQAQEINWRGFDASNFFVCLSVATGGSWFQFVFWLLQAGLVLWKLWRLNMLPVVPDWAKPCCCNA